MSARDHDYLRVEGPLMLGWQMTRFPSKEAWQPIAVIIPLFMYQTRRCPNQQIFRAQHIRAITPKVLGL